MNENDLIKQKDTEIDILIRKNARLKDEVSELRAEVERLQANYTLPKKGFFNLLCGALVYTETLEEYNKFRKEIKSEARKEFAERLCEGRVSNDPVAIVAKVELAEMESERE